MSKSALSLTSRGAAFIASFEGFSATVYTDASGHPTIGYGHKMLPGEEWKSITKGEALDMLMTDAGIQAAILEKAIDVPLKPHEADAIISLAFNVGAWAVSKSTLVRLLNQRLPDVADQFLRWNKARIGGVLKPLRGLTRRRDAERKLFLFADYTVGMGIRSLIDEYWEYEMKSKSILPSILPFILALTSTPIYAAPFVVSDPYPANAPQPAEFVITVSGTTSPVVIPATTTPQGVILKWDVADVKGSKTITAKARNAWGESAASGPFTFTAGTPAAPSGIGLSVQ